MGAQFTINADLGSTWTDADGVEKPLRDIVPGSSALPEDGTMSYSTTALLLDAFGIEFDREFYCGSVGPVIVLMRAPAARAFVAGYKRGYTGGDGVHPERLESLVDALIALAEEADRTPDAELSYG